MGAISLLCGMLTIVGVVEHVVPKLTILGLLSLV